MDERWRQHSSRLDAYRTARANFDLERRAEYTQSNGWRIDDYCIELPAEPPGDPIPGGPWELACDVLHNYEFPDPSLIEGIYIPDAPLAERVMLLKARFLFFTFWFGVRISRVIDEVRECTQGPARVWGYSYYTLDDHFEMGEITFEIWKFLEDGQVEFRIHAYSRTGRISNIFYRIGFAIFGRWLQVRFAHQALERLQRLVIERMENE